MIEFVKEFKSRNMHVPIILGGYPPTFSTNELLQICPSIDYIVRGEGEISLVELIKNLIEGRSIRRINGISFMDDKGNIVHNPDREPIKDLDKLPFPDYDSFLRLGSEFVIETTRGCNFNCTFCSSRQMNGMERIKSVKRTMREIRRVKDLSDSEYILFSSDNFTTNRTWLDKLLDELSKEDLKWNCSSRIDTVNKKILKKMKKANCCQIGSYGVESNNPKILSYINKTNNIPRYVELAHKIPKLTVELGIRTMVNTIIGFPVETKDDLLAHFDFMRELQSEGVQSTASILTVYPGSPLWDKFQKNEFELVKREGGHGFFFSKYVHLPWLVPEMWIPKNRNDDYNKFMELLIREGDMTGRTIIDEYK